MKPHFQGEANSREGEMDQIPRQISMALHKMKMNIQLWKVMREEAGKLVAIR